MPFVRGLLRLGTFSLTLLLGACQAGQRPDDGRATPAVRPVPVARSASHRLPAGSPRYVAARPAKQTLFPDTLRPIGLPVEYWTGPQLDSMRAGLEADTLAISSPVMLWTDRYRVLHADDDYLVLRLFFRPRDRPGRWVELNLNAWLGVYNSLSYMQACAVELDQRPPEELLVEMDGGMYGQGLRATRNHTLLISFDGPPRVIWHSLDGRTEEIPPTAADEQGEMVGGNYAYWRREIGVRPGRIHVGRVHREGKFEAEKHPDLTPITPGTYAYRGGRFGRVPK
jgi:hypothetical protein